MNWIGRYQSTAIHSPRRSVPPKLNRQLQAVYKAGVRARLPRHAFLPWMRMQHWQAQHEFVLSRDCLAYQDTYFEKVIRKMRRSFHQGMSGQLQGLEFQDELRDQYTEMERQFTQIDGRPINYGECLALTTLCSILLSAAQTQEMYQYKRYYKPVFERTTQSLDHLRIRPFELYYVAPYHISMFFFVRLWGMPIYPLGFVNQKGWADIMEVPSYPYLIHDLIHATVMRESYGLEDLNSTEAGSLNLGEELPYLGDEARKGFYDQILKNLEMSSQIQGWLASQTFEDQVRMVTVIFTLGHEEYRFGLNQPGSFLKLLETHMEDGFGQILYEVRSRKLKDHFHEGVKLSEQTLTAVVKRFIDHFTTLS